MARNGTVQDNETRARVLKAAARLFAERGFNHVSVRAICKEAGSNVAAVNYHFGDKLGLYRELIGSVAEGMNDGKISALESGAGRPPEEQLRAYIRGFLHQLLDQNPEETCWLDKLIARETAEPTAAVDLIIEKGIKPAAERLNKLVGEVMELPSNDPRVFMSAGAIQGLCLWYRTSRPVAERMFPKLKFTPALVDQMAEFVANFSLAGMRSLAQNGQGFDAGLLAAR
jgi:TetR/AcrR family transcriptional regulator, regulator of cefoperazone and chloramphenicol sensitivity